MNTSIKIWYLFLSFSFSWFSSLA